MDESRLELEGNIGFCGGVPSGLKVHPDRNHIIYPVGCTIVIENLESNRQEFLSGHTDSISCIAVSKSGNYLASGQITHMGFKADIRLWDYQLKKEHAKLTLHMVKVEALAISPNDKYLVSLGGEDDGSVVVWDIATGDAVCGSPAQVVSAGMTHTICYSNNSDECFITGGCGTLRVWKLDRPNRKIRPVEVNMGSVKRVVRCIEMEQGDEYFYCGTTTGDVLCVNMNSYHFQCLGPEKKDNKFSLGVTSMSLLKTGEIIVGSGDGTVAIVQGRNQKFKRTKKEKKLQYSSAGSITSISLRGEGHQFFVGTEKCSIFKFTFAEFTAELTNTCHSAPITDVAFPYGTGELFVTSSEQQIRIWASRTSKELLRITVPNMTCTSIQVMQNGKGIISGWDDGRIRAFAPETGKPMFTINDAHKGGVSALALFSDCNRIVSGGREGSLRVWSVEYVYHPVPGSKNPDYRFKTGLLFALKEHTASITCIKLRKNNKECVTSSMDGSCIIWDLENKKRLQMFRVNTLFQFVCYHPDEAQVIATGTDRKVSYYEIFDSSCIRELEGSKAGAINCLDISHDGRFFVSGGDDKIVKVWDYHLGEVMHIGIGHSASISRVKISPQEDFIVSVSCDGAILRWRFPLKAPQY